MLVKQNHKSLTTKQTHNTPTISPLRFCKEEKDEETLRAQNKHTTTKSSQSIEGLLARKKMLRGESPKVVANRT